jgi:hypothetical protein
LYTRHLAALAAGWKRMHWSNWVAKHLAHERLFSTAKRLEAACTGRCTRGIRTRGILPRWLPGRKTTHWSNRVAKHLARKRLFGTAKRLEAACTGLLYTRHPYTRHLAALVAGRKRDAPVELGRQASRA